MTCFGFAIMFHTVDWRLLPLQ